MRSLPYRLFREASGHEVAGTAVLRDQVHGNLGELEGYVLLGPMAYLEHRHTRAFPVQEIVPGLLQGLEG